MASILVKNLFGGDPGAAGTYTLVGGVWTNGIYEFINDSGGAGNTEWELIDTSGSGTTLETSGLGDLDSPASASWVKYSVTEISSPSKLPIGSGSSSSVSSPGTLNPVSPGVPDRPENYVGTFEQALTLGQKAQAVDNIGLGNVDNTADADKPVSTLQAAADAAVLAAALAADGSGATLDPFYIAAIGQSNMARADKGVASYDMDSLPGVKVFVDRPITGQGTFQEWTPATTSQTLSTASSIASTTPAFHLAKKIHEETGREVRVVMMAQGGQNLTWMSDGGAGWPRIVDGVDNGPVAKFDLVVLIQGEAEDSGSDVQHLTRLQTWVDDLRALTPTAGGDPVIPYTTPIILTELDAQYTNANRRMREFAEANDFVYFADGASDLPKIVEVPANVHITGDACPVLARQVIWPALFQARQVDAAGGVATSRATVTTGTQYVTVGGAALSTLTGDFTFKARLRPDFASHAELILHGGTGQVFADFGRTGATDSYLSFLQLQSRQIRVSINSSTVTADRLTITIPDEILESGNTFELSVTWNSTTGEALGYVDGVAAGSATTTIRGPLTAPASSRLLGEVFGTRHCKFVTKWMAIWDSILPIGEITTIHDGLPDLALTGSGTPALASYTFDTPQGGIIPDRSGNSRNGTWAGSGAYSRTVR